MGPAGTNGCVRRGASIAAVVLVLAIVNVVVVAAVRGGTDENQTAAMRVETARAFFAAESGATVIVRCLQTGQDPPPERTVLPIGNAEAEIVALPDAGSAGSVVVEGRAGFGVRRVALWVE